ncbi:MAG: hypothetical protein JW861_14545 [Bacteroidales bacterium]|nr:hypothetical protein [Bacteroidales bacterium]
MKPKTILIIILLMSSVFPGYSQDKPGSNLMDGWSVNVNIGANLFYGDIEVYNFFPVTRNNSEWRVAYGLMAQKEISRILTLRGQFIKGKLSGTKRKYAEWFEADILETSMGMTVNLSSLFFGVRPRALSVYGLVGVGLSQWQTELKKMYTNETIRSNGFTDGSGIGGRTVEGVLPFGLGLDYRIDDHWNINLEGTLRPVNSDLLDANKGDFPYDFYSYNFAGISYRFTRKKVRPPVELPQEDMIVIQEEPEEPAVDEEMTDIEAEQARQMEQDLMKKEEGAEVHESPWREVEFRIQIAALKDEVLPGQIAAEYRLGEDIKMDYSDGWYRYSVGSFSKYWKAREFKKVLISRNHIEDAFVVAYRGDERLDLAGLLTGEDYSEAGEGTGGITPEIDLLFRVQVMATTSSQVTTESIQQQLNISSEVYRERSGVWYQFTVGDFKDFQEAEKIRLELMTSGIRDAFIVAYKNGRRVPLSEAIMK